MTYKTCLARLAKSPQKNILSSKEKMKLSTINQDIITPNPYQFHLLKNPTYNPKRKLQIPLPKSQNKLLKQNSSNAKINSNSPNPSLNNSLDKSDIIPSSVMIANPPVDNIMSSTVN